MNPHPRSIVLIALMAWLVPPLRAAEFVWTGAAGDGSWNHPGNWRPSTGFPGAGDDVVFPEAAANVTVRLNGGQAARSVTFHPVALFSYTLEGAALTLDDGGKIRFLKLAADVGPGKSAVQTIASDLVLAGSATIGNENRWYFGGELLRIDGAIRGSGTIVIDSGLGGCVGFGGDNKEFTGALVIRKGMLYATHPAALGSGDSPVRLDGGMFWVGAVPTRRDFRISGDASWSAVQSPSGPHSGTVAVSAGATWEYGSGGNSSKFTGRITGAGDTVWKSGSHGTVIGGTEPNSLSGSHVIGGGLIVLAKPAGVDAVAGPLAVSAGATLRWEADEQVADGQPLKLAGDSCTLELNGRRETLGGIELRGNSRIVCGTGANVLQAADSHGLAWDLSKELIVEKWKGGGIDRIVVGNGPGALTPEQLACVGFRSPAGLPEGLFAGAILPTGELVPGRPVRPVDPPFDLSDAARDDRRKLYEVAGRARLAGGETPLKKGMKISFFGDSITWGGGYIGLIEQALKAGEGSKDLGVRLINHGINGGGVMTLRDGEAAKSHVGDTHPRPFGEYLAEDRPEVVVIFVGVNDIWWRETAAADFEQALRDLVAVARERRAVPVLATLALWGDSPVAANPNNAKCDEFAAITRRVAADGGATLVDLRRACVAYLQNHNPQLRLNGSLSFSDTGVLTGDGVHLNGAGTALVADKISQGIFEALVK
jgi:lysophospholipase L1-like esterase